MGPWGTDLRHVSISLPHWLLLLLVSSLCSLSGVSPFFGENPQITRFHIKEVRYDFNASAFEQVSQDAKGFIRSLLQLNPQ